MMKVIERVKKAKNLAEKDLKILNKKRRITIQHKLFYYFKIILNINLTYCILISLLLSFI